MGKKKKEGYAKDLEIKIKNQIIFQKFESFFNQFN